MLRHCASRLLREGFVVGPTLSHSDPTRLADPYWRILMSDQILQADFVVVGLGPTGLLATAYLASIGYTVIAVERHSEPYALPRAGHVDHEIVRYLQELEVEAAFLGQEC